MLIISCDNVIAEARNIVKVCQEIQEDADAAQREEIFNLLTLVKAKWPRYTAAGYFVVNRSSLFALFSVATTYFIILVQFHQNL